MRCWACARPPSCRRQELLSYFEETLPEPCGNCDTCLEPVKTYDGTQVVQKLLSCVYRTGERFGAGHVIDVLLGVSNDRVLKLGHEKISTSAIGKDLTSDAWRAVVRQVVAHGLLQVDVEGALAASASPPNAARSCAASARSS